MAKFLHDEWLYDLQNYHYSRDLRSIKQQEEVTGFGGKVYCS